MDYMNPGLDREAIRAALEQDRRVLIRDFFVPSVAEALSAALEPLDWRLLFRDDSGDRELTGEQLRSLTPADRASLSALVNQLAERQFQFFFHSHKIVDAEKRGDADVLTRCLRWMADDQFMSLMRDISGMQDIDRVYAQATAYTRGNYLRLHTDEVAVEDRRLAYVINLTRSWSPDWGGLLHFADEDGNIIDTFLPHFNSVALFKVPQKHFVSYVAPYAQGPRHAITGWIVAG